MSIAGLVLLGIIVLFIFFMVGIYNRLVTLRNRFKNAFAQIDVQLKRRYDLIPNLVETVSSRSETVSNAFAQIDVQKGYEGLHEA